MMVWLVTVELYPANLRTQEWKSWSDYKKTDTFICNPILTTCSIYVFTFIVHNQYVTMVLMMIGLWIMFHCSQSVWTHLSLCVEPHSLLEAFADGFARIAHAHYWHIYVLCPARNC
jgi:predicted MFS family arabinose efflux permease